MFVSSYTTYISANTSDKINQKHINNKKDELKSSASKLLETQVQKLYTHKNLPIDYVHNYKSFNNQQKLQEDIKTPDEIKFQKAKDMKNAKNAYEENSKIFSLLKKSTMTLSNANPIENSLPQNIQELKNKNLRNIMVNTYLENDKYYKITA
ncbi:MAG: hypothetical protein L3J10_05000 [Sulfurimonas sp.]|nr:hypothetical protein [Sulfurimonas sp.]